MSAIRAVVTFALGALAGWMYGRPSNLHPLVRPSGPFPRQRELEGGFDRRSADAVNGAQATYDGVVAVSMIERHKVEGVLPPGLRLARSLSGSAFHPVVHLIGVQRDPSGLVDGDVVGIPEAEDYREMILLIPFVQFGSGTRWHNYSACMYLDDRLAVDIGNVVYNYNKQRAQLDSKGGLPDRQNTLVKSEGGTRYFYSSVDVDQAFRPVAEVGATLPRFSEIRDIMDMPIVGCSEFGHLKCSYFEWNYDNAYVAPVTNASSNYEDAFARHVPYGNWRPWTELPALGSSPDGGFALRGIRWRLSLDLPPCRTS
jgi:hypothetical protein